MCALRERERTVMKITTKYSTNSHGAGRIIAKCGGKQLTLGYDHALSATQNHATAAAMLASKLHLSGFCDGVLEGLGYAFYNDRDRECTCSKYFISDRRTARFPAP